jgi:hypothetical protein
MVKRKPQEQVEQDSGLPKKEGMWEGRKGLSDNLDLNFSSMAREIERCSWLTP